MSKYNSKLVQIGNSASPAFLDILSSSTKIDLSPSSTPVGRIKNWADAIDQSATFAGALRAYQINSESFNQRIAFKNSLVDIKQSIMTGSSSASLNSLGAANYREWWSLKDSDKVGQMFAAFAIAGLSVKFGIEGAQAYRLAFCFLMSSAGESNFDPLAAEGYASKYTRLASGLYKGATSPVSNYNGEGKNGYNKHTGVALQQWTAERNTAFKKFVNYLASDDVIIQDPFLLYPNVVMQSALIIFEHLNIPRFKKKLLDPSVSLEELAALYIHIQRGLGETNLSKVKSLIAQRWAAFKPFIDEDFDVERSQSFVKLYK